MSIKNIDAVTFNLHNSLLNFSKSVKDRHLFSITESSFEFGSGISYLSYYAAWIPNNLNRICSIFSVHIPHIAAFINAKLEGVPLMSMLAYLGFATNGFKLCKESLSLIRQEMFLSIFERYGWNGSKLRHTLKEVVDNYETKATFCNSLPAGFKRVLSAIGGVDALEELGKKIDAGDQDALKQADEIFKTWTGRDIRDTLEKIKNMPSVALERALPDWLNEDLAAKGGKDYLNDLLKKVYKADQTATDEATKLLDNMKSYASKKRILHALGIAAALVGGISCVGFIIACPFALTLALLIIISILAICVYVARRGYVENRNGDFSFKACIPEWLPDMPSAAKTAILNLFKTSEVEEVRIPPQFRYAPHHLLPPSLQNAALKTSRSLRAVIPQPLTSISTQNTPKLAVEILSEERQKSPLKSCLKKGGRRNLNVSFPLSLATTSRREVKMLSEERSNVSPLNSCLKTAGSVSFSLPLKQAVVF